MLLYRFCRLILIILNKTFFKMEVSGRTFIPKSGGFILASNHTSNLDPLILGAACPRLLNFMAKEDLFANPFFGHGISMVGAFPVKRGNADISAIKEAISRLKRGRVLVVFPEGTRAGDKDNPRPQPGIGLLASRAGCPIVPVFISGAEKVLPPGSHRIKLAKIRVRFGKPRKLTDKQPYEDIAREVIKDILSLK